MSYECVTCGKVIEEYSGPYYEGWTGKGIFTCGSFCREKYDDWKLLEQRVKELENMLEDVVNELDLSEGAIAEHGPHGTPPAELVKLVLQEKDKKIVMLKAGMKALTKEEV